MAKSSGAKGFEYRRSLIGQAEQPIPVKVRMANSTTFTLGDAVRLNTGGFLVVCAAGEPVLGVLIGIVDNSGDAKGGGVNPLSRFYVNNTGATLTGDDTVTTGSSNQTAANYLLGEVAVDPAGIMLFYNDANGDFAQTNVGQYVDTTSSGDQIDQASASDTNGQFELLILDPDNDGDLSKGLFRIAESQLGGGIDSGTAKIGA